MARKGILITSAAVLLFLAVMVVNHRLSKDGDQGVMVDSTKVKHVDTQTALRQLDSDTHMPEFAKAAARAQILAHQTRGR